MISITVKKEWKRLLCGFFFFSLENSVKDLHSGRAYGIVPIGFIKKPAACKGGFFMSIIQAEHLTFGYEGAPENVFEDLSFHLDTDWKLGLIARNGKGKTTLLRLLKGELKGQGSVRISVPVEYFPPQVEKEECLTIEVLEKHQPQAELWEICRECNYMNLDTELLYRPFKTLSSGEKTKVLLAGLFARESAFLLIDEPTNHLDGEARAAIGEYLKSKKGFILVSHDRKLLDLCVDHVMVLNREVMEIRQGNFSAWWKDKMERDEFERRENEKLKKEIGRLSKASVQTKAWADQVESRKIGRDPYDGGVTGGREYLGEKSRKMQMRRKNLERRQQRAIEEKKELLKNVETVEDLKLMPLVHHKEVLAEVKECTLAYPEKTVAEQVDFTIKRGEKIFLCGCNGCGKSSVLKVLLSRMGWEFPKEENALPIIQEGSIQTASGLIVSYVPQDASFLKGSLMEFAKSQKLDETVFLTLLRKLDFPREHFKKDMSCYSAGQKKKVLLAASLSMPAHLYVWDEPLNYIDVFSRIQVEELLKGTSLTLLAVEHDQLFRRNINGREIFLFR